LDCKKGKEMTGEVCYDDRIERRTPELRDLGHPIAAITAFDMDRVSLQLQQLATGTRRVGQGECLVRSHTRLRNLYFVRYGAFKVVTGTLQHEHVLGFLMAGDLMGLGAIATGEHQGKLVALDASEVYEIPFDSVARAMNAEPEIQLRFLQILSRALSSQCSHSTSLAKMSHDQRFADFLLTLGAKFESIGYSGTTFRLSMSRADIASHIGTAAETVSRLTARFNKQGAVLIQGRDVAIINRPYLLSLQSGAEQGNA
jgi:CRP/FNR family transcriptional regulator